MRTNTKFAARPLKSHRRKFGKRRESSTRGARGSPPRLIADDPIHVDSSILLEALDSGFGLGPEITVHRTRIGRRDGILLETLLQRCHDTA